MHLLYLTHLNLLLQHNYLLLVILMLILDKDDIRLRNLLLHLQLIKLFKFRHKIRLLVHSDRAAANVVRFDHLQ
jgi:hypothetical protein